VLSDQEGPHLGRIVLQQHIRSRRSKLWQLQRLLCRCFGSVRRQEWKTTRRADRLDRARTGPAPRRATPKPSRVITSVNCQPWCWHEKPGPGDWAVTPFSWISPLPKVATGPLNNWLDCPLDTSALCARGRRRTGKDVTATTDHHGGADRCGCSHCCHYLWRYSHQRRRGTLVGGSGSCRNCGGRRTHPAVRTNDSSTGHSQPWLVRTADRPGR
jgi:hypothetical protein